MNAELKSRPDYLRNIGRHPFAALLSAVGTAAVFGGLSGAVNGTTVGVILGTIGFIVGATFGAMTAESALAR